MRLLYIPHETEMGGQTGFRAAFSQLEKEGRIEKYIAFPFLVELKTVGSWSKMLDKLMNTAKEFLPTAIYWELHQRGIVPPEYTRALKALPSKPVICQSNGDSHFKPQKEMIIFGREIDITYLAGTGQAHWYSKAGCHNVRLLPHFIDKIYFDALAPWVPTENRTFDVIMIANKPKKRNPFKRANDGYYERIELVKALTKRFGKRFGLFGERWENYKESYQGILPYVDQISMTRNSWCSIGTNNWNKIDHYFSDRPFFAMASGVPHITRYIPHLEDFFADKYHCFFFHSISEAIKIVDLILNDPLKYQHTVGKNASSLIIEKHTADHRAIQIIHDLETITANGKNNPRLEFMPYSFFLGAK